MNVLASGLLSLVATQALAKDPVARTLAPELAKIACPGEDIDRRAAAWDAGLFDAQVEGRYLEKLGSRVVGKADAERKAKALARVKRYGSYAFGLCDGGNGWAMAFPGPSPLVKRAHESLWTLPIGALKDRCASFRVDAAQSGGGAPVELAVAFDKVDTAKVANGTLSVTCQPREPRWQGPVVWYLAPIGDGPAQVVPEAGILGSSPNTAAALTAWIGRLRSKEGLPAIETSPELLDQATTLAVDGNLTHDRQMLQKASAFLKDHDIKFLGEDRVRGTDAQSMAWLLWNSPRHRGLLLAKDANALGIGLRSLGSEQLAVIVLGSRAPLTTARSDSAPRRPKR